MRRRPTKPPPTRRRPTRRRSKLPHLGAASSSGPPWFFPLGFPPSPLRSSQVQAERGLLAAELVLDCRHHHQQRDARENGVWRVLRGAMVASGRRVRHGVHRRRGPGPEQPRSAGRSGESGRRAAERAGDRHRHALVRRSGDGQLRDPGRLKEIHFQEGQPIEQGRAALHARRFGLSGAARRCRGQAQAGRADPQADRPAVQQ